MMQAAHLRKRDNPTDVRSLNWSRLRRILLQSEVRSAVVIVGEESNEVAAQAAFRQDDHVIEAFASDRADHAFDEGALPVSGNHNHC